jgi:hypothetical protein
LRAKELLAGIAAAAVFGSCAFLDIRADYDWAPSYAVKASERGWRQVASRDNASDLVRPWTIFWTPVTSLWLVDTTRVIRFDSSKVGVPVLAAHWDYEGTEEFRSFLVADLRQGHIVDVYGDSTLASLDGLSSRWQVPSTLPDSAVLSYLTASAP